MKIALFCHSALSDWNHGNAHFLRGVATELQARGHEATFFEPADAWSAANLVADHGEGALARTLEQYPTLDVVRYDPHRVEPEPVLERADLVLVHEWTDPALVARIGRHHARHAGYTLFFHDTHHRSVTAADEMARYDLSHYDGVLAFGEVIRRRYLDQGWAARAWTWHEAADARRFAPRPDVAAEADLVWIGNWGDDERKAELREYLFEPAARLGLRGTIHGVRYPDEALRAIGAAGLTYGGWLANYDAPAVFARHRVTVHVPRRPYVEQLPGIPTIRPFEALACGIPLVSASWRDEERLFREGTDYLQARSGAEMTELLRAVLNDRELAASLAAHGRETILARHTCAHRVDELLAIVASLRAPARQPVHGAPLPVETT